MTPDSYTDLSHLDNILESLKNELFMAALAEPDPDFTVADLERAHRRFSALRNSNPRVNNQASQAADMLAAELDAAD